MRRQVRIEGGGEEDEDQRTGKLRPNPGDRVVDRRTKPRVPNRYGRHQGRRQRRDHDHDADPEDDVAGQEVNEVGERWKVRPHVVRLELPWRAGRRHPGEPQHAQRHDDRPHGHEDSRAVLRSETSESWREEDQEYRAWYTRGARGRGRITERALLEKAEIVKRDVQRAVDQQGRDVRDGEVARTKKLERDERVLRAHHPPRTRRRGQDADRQDHVAEGIAPGALLAVDRAECETAHGQGDDGGPDPVERWSLALLAALRNVFPRRPRGYGYEGDVDEERGAPRDRVDEDATNQRSEDRGRA